ncbi:hypothetical protein BHE74_00036504 [Ensete ventricosum]|nr:hypothetical protein GW17_00001232 [Ensete ventricosum]RWW56752.1 hypothetical protein BHE74_00036504 [Ensete ventricosum]RZR86517.1 hypothetical protein BHM03_00013737 [Ensete ventricosum]
MVNTSRDEEHFDIRPKFAISTCIARYGRYIPVRQVTGMRTGRYRAVPPKIDRRRSIVEEIDCRRSIEREIDCRWSIEEEKGKKKRKRKKRRGEERIPRPRTILTRLPSSPVGRLRAVTDRGLPTATAAFSPA